MGYSPYGACVFATSGLGALFFNYFSDIKSKVILKLEKYF
jgi:hypothetical protein